MDLFTRTDAEPYIEPWHDEFDNSFRKANFPGRLQLIDHHWGRQNRGQGSPLASDSVTTTGDQDATLCLCVFLCAVVSYDLGQPLSSVVLLFQKSAVLTRLRFLCGGRYGRTTRVTVGHQETPE